MTQIENLIAQAYTAFNRRDIDAALALMSESISWPKASEGGRILGKEEIRAYWRRQWDEFDPRVEPIEVLDRGVDGVHVRVRQVVRSLQGELLSDSEVWHVYALSNGLIESMKLGGIESDGQSQASPTSAFVRP